MTVINLPQDSGSVPPNQGALDLYADPGFQQLVENEVVDCSQLAQELQARHDKKGAIPRAEWEAKITELNGEMGFEYFPARSEEPLS